MLRRACRRVLAGLPVLALVAGATGAGPVHAQVPRVAPSAAADPAGWIGISVEMTGTLEADGRHRTVVEVTGVRPEGPAGQAGLRAGDVLLSLNGRTPDQGFAHMLGSLAPGDPVSVRVRRAGEERTFRFEAGTRPRDMAGSRTFTVLVQADTLADRLYRAMDSLRVRIARGEGPEAAVVASGIRVTSGASDSLVTVFGRTGEPVEIRELLAPDATGGTGRILRLQAPPAAPRDDRPFRLLIMGDSVEGVRAIPRLLEEPRDGARRWTTDEGTEVAVTLRPLAPYALGRNRAAGAEVVELKPELASYFQVDRGVLVVDVAPGTPAARAGVQPGDVLTRIGSMEVGSVAEFRAGLAQPRDSLAVSLIRKGRRLEVLLRR